MKTKKEMKMMKNRIWHDRIEIPDNKEELLVYDFEDWIAFEEYNEEFFDDETLIKWAKWEDIEKAIDEIKELKKQNLLLSIANAELQDRFYSMKEVKK